MTASKPEAIRYSFDGYGWLYVDNGSGPDFIARFYSAAYPDAEPLYDEAALAAARAEGLEQGLRVAAAYHEAMAADEDALSAKYRGGSNPWFAHVQTAKWHREHHSAIRALIPARPNANGGDTLASVLRELAQRQEPLGAAFERALDADRERLYEP